ncbi:hypothetical protein GCM10023328_10030 [Modestobacter marinus]|uniref:Uncharacterized protein n=1 Tax=Modestobacter marinus TaxID=477641 RepID=A0A846LR33_9ACTN|nr:hypothetical protein [Modestobacter marinus]NIH69931.1 hypothetical protein [Modestobacter marinus]GGL82604.1 hypothetical protein GCM10011589_43820 [Modestobacter marinus]
MGTRYEFAAASTATVELWSSAEVAEQTGEELPADQVALTLAGDEATVLVGTPGELRALVEKIASAVAEKPCELRILIPGEVDEFLTCPHCGSERSRTRPDSYRLATSPLVITQ